MSLERARRDAEENWRYDSPNLAELREWGQRLNRAMNETQILDIILCPLCRCLKSDDADTPNKRTGACEDGRCACHEETE
jgi:hypothetical protein